MKKSKSALAKMAQLAADKIKNFHEDSFKNQEANKLVDYNKIAECVRHLEDIASLLNQAR